MSSQDLSVDDLTDSYQLWVYPTLDLSKELPDALEPPLEISPQHIDDIIFVQDESNAQEEQAKEQHNSQLKLIENITQELKKLSDHFDEDLLHDMFTCIKKITKKIILKELDTNQDQLKLMILDTVNRIKDSKPALVLVSSDDYEYLKSVHELNGLDLRIDPILTKGDFKIESSAQQIQSILEQRLNEFFGLSP